MNPTVLVVTTIHDPDDTRIRERLIRSLGGEFDVRYAAREPGPSSSNELTWLPLRGGRLRRDMAAAGHLVTGSWDVAVVHDPELVPAAAFARLIRRKPVVFDVHEDLPAQIASKTWIPRLLQPVARLAARGLYRLAERTLFLTLAESGYGSLFRKEHPVFPNFPFIVPDAPIGGGDGTAVYLGDMTEARGIGDAVAAAGRAGVPLDLIGRASEGFLRRLQGIADETGARIRHLGRIPNPEALLRISQASVGLSPLRDEPNYRGSLPTKTIEYLQMGLPVVATDLPGTRAYLADLEAVTLVPPSDVAAMAAAITESVRPEVKSIAAAQVAGVRRRFRWPDGEVKTFYLGLTGR